MRRLLACLGLLAALAGCGRGSDDARKAARYLHPDSQLVASIDLDYGGGQWGQLKDAYKRVAGEANKRKLADGELPETLEGYVDLFVGGSDISFQEDIRPLLKGRLLIGVHATPAAVGRERAASRPRSEVTVAFKVADADKLDDLLEKVDVKRRALRGVDDVELIDDEVAVVKGDTLLFTDDGGGDRSTENEGALRARLRGKGPPKRMLPRDDGDALVRVRATPGLLGLALRNDELERALATAPGRALRGADASLELTDDGAQLDGRVDFEGLPADQLPLPGPGQLSLPSDAGVASGSADQSLTTVFISRLVREIYPESRFVRRVEALERREGIRFEDEVLRQFSGPSHSTLQPLPNGDTEFSAASTLRDPAAMRRLLPRLAPRLPAILEGLEGLGTVGLSSLLLVAPDAPLTPDSLKLLAQVDVERLPPAPATQAGDEELLYEIRGLEQRGVNGLDRVIYGVVGDKFVVGSDRVVAREAAERPTENAEAAGTRTRVDVARILRAAGETDDDTELLEALLDSAEIEASAKGGDVVVSGQVRYAD